MEGLIFIAAALMILCIVLPIVAFVRTNKIRDLELRMAGVEAALRRVLRQQGEAAEPLPGVTPEIAPGTAPPAAQGSPAPQAPLAYPPAPEPLAPVVPAAARPRQHLEAVIGEQWLGWVAVVLIFCAAAFFLKYAFENRWIGELGRVALGIATGLAFAWAGLERYRKGWPDLSQILTAGGITILYLSVYSAFGYYHLVDQRTAFLFLLILVA